MRDIDKAFGGKPALSGVCLEVRAGEVHALLGENGAGKTTLMNVLYGLYPKDSGVVSWEGREVAIASPLDAIARRIGMVHQHFMLVPTLTVSQNITLGLKPVGYPFVRRAAVDEEIARLSCEYGLDLNPRTRVDSLSVGERQRVEIVKLLYRNSRLLIFDEPTAVLTPQETEKFFSVLDRLKDDGRSAVVITHRIPEVRRVSDRITVLRAGRNAGTFETAGIDEAELSRCMVGRAPAPLRRGSRTFSSSDEGLSLRGLRLEKDGVPRLDDLTLVVAPGEILGVAGVDGNGQKELADLVLGLQCPTEGTVNLDGVDLTALSVGERRRRGIACVSDDRLTDGLIGDMDLTENMLLQTGASRAYVRRGLVAFRAARRSAQKAVEEYSIKTPSLSTPVRLLSGGNQQKLILAREMGTTPKALVAFQPTRGLDLGATDFVHRRLLEHRAGGCRILLISADLDEIMTLSDRIAVLCKGRVTGILPNEGDVDVAHIGLLMAGKTNREAENR